MAAGDPDYKLLMRERRHRNREQGPGELHPRTWSWQTVSVRPCLGFVFQHVFILKNLPLPCALCDSYSMNEQANVHRH